MIDTWMRSIAEGKMRVKRTTDGKSRSSVCLPRMAMPISLPTKAYIDKWREEVQAGFGMNFSLLSPKSDLELGHGMNSGTAGDCKSAHMPVIESRNRPPASTPAIRTPSGPFTTKTEET